eukprot:1157218-Pelagomonas_calceolata.AAC.20
MDADYMRRMLRLYAVINSDMHQKHGRCVEGSWMLTICTECCGCMQSSTQICAKSMAAVKDSDVRQKHGSGHGLGGLSGWGAAVYRSVVMNQTPARSMVDV